MSRDPWLAQRMRAQDRLRRTETAVHAGVMKAMTLWLDATRALVLGQPLPAEVVRLLDSPTAITAAGAPDLDAASAAAQVWARGVTEHVDPALSEAFGDAFLDAARRADISPLPFQLDYLEQVHDRLKIWPEGAFEELRPELLEMLSEGMDYDQMTERIGRLLHIDAPTRRIRAQISEIDRQLDDPATARGDKAALRARKRALWQQHDESLHEWQWKARRIARTETHGATEGGALAGALAVEAAGGQAHYKRWAATSDERTRGTHVVAEGQIVKLREAFTVGRAKLQHPGEAGGPADEVIQCRCTTFFLREDEVQAELQGQWGGRGVSPGGARIGPDDEDDAAAALDKWKREQRGELDDAPEDQDEVTPPDPIEDGSEPTDPDPDPLEDDTENEDEDYDLDELDPDTGDDSEPEDPDAGGTEDPGKDGSDDQDQGDLDDQDDDDDDLGNGDEKDEEEDDQGDALDEDPDDDGESDDLDDFFSQFDDDEQETQDTEPEDPEDDPILSASTRAHIERARHALPDDAAGWAAVTAPREIRPAEKYIDRYMWELGRDLDIKRAEAEAVRADPRLAGLRELDSDALWWELDKRRKQLAVREGKLSRARSANSIAKLGRDRDKLSADCDLVEKYMNLLSGIEANEYSLKQLRDKPPQSKHWQSQTWPLSESVYRTDSYGNLLPPAALEAHLDAVLAVGDSLWEDIAAAMDRDPALRQARLAEDKRPQTSQQLHDARRERVRIEADLIRAAMAEVREFGGHEQRAMTTLPPDVYQRSKDPVRTAKPSVLANLRAAEPVFPREWLEAADARSELVLGQVQRAFFVKDGGGGGRDLITGHAPGSFFGGISGYDGAFENYEIEVMAHELGHRMEMAVPGLTALEYALVRRRATHQGQLEFEKEIYPGSGEYALADKWRDAYAGKHYSKGSKDPAAHAHEAFQVGIQDLLGRGSTSYGDEDGGQLSRFMVAAMVLL